MRLKIRRVDWPLRVPFRHAYHTYTHSEAVILEIGDGFHFGRGEAVGVSYLGETPDSLVSQVETVKREIEDGIGRRDLQVLLPPGGARNAVDCALWDLEAKRAGRRAWELAGMPSVTRLKTAYTLPVDTPEEMANAALRSRQYDILKLKLCGEGDVQRVAAVRNAHPQAVLIVDVNQAWSEEQLLAFAPRMAELDVQLIEQPLPAGKDEMLAKFQSPVPLCADESCQTSNSLPQLVGKYDYINVKLDKTGGLTEALALAYAGRVAGFKIMTGCMGGSSLAMAPAFIVGQLSNVVDLDVPLLLSWDQQTPLKYDGSVISPPHPTLWG